LLKEFREFISRGNLIDFAVAFVMGAAFSTVVTALTDRIVTPLIGLVFSVEGLDNLGTFADGAGSVGAFLRAVINFLIVAWVMFLVVKAYNRMRKPAEAGPATPPEEVLLLREIRDGLNRQ
jgi:large conductance mechanosensitive channel